MRPFRPLPLFVALLAGLSSVLAHADSVEVTSLGDGTGSCPGASCTLRAALAAAAPGDVVTFSPTLSLPATIVLSQGQLLIDRSLRIEGPGAERLGISAGLGSRVIEISAGEVEIEGLRLASGLVSGSNALPTPPNSGQTGQAAGAGRGGCVLVGQTAVLSLRQVTLQDCRAIGGNGADGARGTSVNTPGAFGGVGGGGGAGGAGEGGGIYLLGTLLMEQSSIFQGQTQGGQGGNGGNGGPGGSSGFEGNGGNGGPGGASLGAAIAVGNGGSLLLRNSTLAGGVAQGGTGGNGGTGGALRTGGDGGEGGVAEGGALRVSSGPGTHADLEFATLAEIFGTGGNGGLAGSGGTVGLIGPNGQMRGLSIAAGSGGGVRLRSTAVLGSCDGQLFLTGSNLRVHGSCALFSTVGALADFFGPYLQYGQWIWAPLPGTPAVDGAESCFDLASEPVGIDHLGRPRPQDGNGDGEVACDIGAIEISPRIFADGFE